MRIAPDGGYGSSASSDTNTNTPTPAQQQAKVTAAQTTVNQDKSQLQSTQNTLNQVENQEDARVQQMMALQKAVAALQAQLKADQAALAADQKDLNKSVSTEVTQQTNQAVKDLRTSCIADPRRANRGHGHIRARDRHFQPGSVGLRAESRRAVLGAGLQTMAAGRAGAAR